MQDKFRLWGILRLNFLFNQMQIAANVAINNLVETLIKIRLLLPR